MTAARTATIAIAALIFGPVFIMLMWAEIVSARATLRNFIRWRHAVRRDRRHPTGAGIGAAG